MNLQTRPRAIGRSGRTMRRASFAVASAVLVAACAGDSSEPDVVADDEVASTVPVPEPEPDTPTTAPPAVDEPAAPTSPEPTEPDLPCDSEPVVRTSTAGVEFVRTPDACFEDLPDWPYEPQYVEIDGLRQAYVDEGPEDGEVVLLLHGQPSWSYLYRHMIPVLADAGYRVIAMDHLGTGRSDKPTEVSSYGYVDHVDRLEAFITELGLTDINLFVQDWGSLIGLNVAGTNPESFATIAVGNGTLPVIPAGVEVFPPVENPDEIVDIPSGFGAIPPQQPSFYDGCELRIDRDELYFADWMTYAMTAESFTASEVVEAMTWFDLSPEEEAAYDAPFPSREYMVAIRTFPSLINEVPGETDDAWAGLTSFEDPFLTLWASNDPGQLGSCEVQQNFVDNVPGAAGQPHDRLPEASHFLQDDQGTEIATRLVDWYASLDADAATGPASLPALGDGPGIDADAVELPFYDDRILAADIWDDELRILSGGMGFDGVIGWPDEELETIRAGGGSYFVPECGDDPIVSGARAATVDALYRGVADDTPDDDDGLPVVFTWPVLTSTVHPEDFLVTLNNGEQVVPNSAGMIPNYELNERNTIVLFGDFGNRLSGDEALYVERLEIVDDGTPLRFLGPDGEQSGVGLVWDDGGSPYERGPVLVGAKLNRVGESAEGEGGADVFDNVLLPNDEFALYGGGDFRIRLLTSGGYTPTGITSLTPDAYEDHFRVQATAADGSTVRLTEVGVDYEVAGGTLRVLGLADLGKAESRAVQYDDCYVEDADNQIDIILEGDEAAARSITFVEVPADGDYLPLYNPGGPGPDPFPGVTYTAPGPPDLEPVIIALDDPMRVSNVGSDG